VILNIARYVTCRRPQQAMRHGANTLCMQTRVVLLVKCRSMP
jgi:hypothetical protein